MSKKYSYNEVVDIVKDKGYKLLDNKYISVKTLMKIQDKDGYLYQSTLGNLLFGVKPRVADSRNPYSINNIKLWLILNNKSFKLISNKYINKDDKLQWKCKKDNNIWSASWHSIYSSSKGCPKCNGGVRFEYDFIKSDFLNYGYKLLNKEYNNVSEKLTLTDNYGYKYYSSYEVFKRGNKVLDKFSKFNPYTIDNIKLWTQLNNKSFELLSDEYENNISSLKWKCSKCNKIFYNAWVDIYDNGGCNLCTRSKGENKVEQFLDLNYFEYKQQYIFNDCKNKRVLPFDFYLPEYMTCIEVQGKQHYESVEYFGGEENFKLRQKLDKIKRDYCQNNNIKLIEIAYWEFGNIEQILIKELNLNNTKAGDVSA